MTIGKNNKYDYEHLYKEIITNYPHYKAIINYIRNVKPLGRDEWYELWLAYRRENEYALDRMIDLALKTILRIAYDFSNRFSIELDDTFSLGYIGFLKAIEKYDCFTSTYSFVSFYQTQIRYYIWDQYFINNNYLYTPSSMMRRMRKLNYLCIKEQINIDNTCFSSEEILMIAHYLESSIEEVDVLIGCLKKNEIYDDENIYCIDNSKNPVDIAYQKELRNELKNLIFTLTKRERKVLVLRFGLDDGCQRTLEEVGKEFGVTRERIRQIEAKALRKLKHPTRSRRLRNFVNSI